MDITLAKEDEAKIYNHIQMIIMNVIKDTGQITEINSVWIKGKKKTSEWLDVSIQTLNKLINAGLPVHYIDEIEKVAFFNKDEITSFLLSM